MARTPWLTSDQLISTIQRKIAIPIAQVTFSNDDILAFVYEEMLVSQVPSVLEYNEEYYVYSLDVPLESDKDRYPIPDRAVGMRLRDIAWKDSSGNIFEMSRVDAGDKAFFQRNTGSNQAIHKFYVENNEIVLLPGVGSSPTGSLVFYFYMRPSILVQDENAATITAFSKDVTVSNTSLIAGNTITVGSITFTAVAGAPSTNEFQIGGTAIVTATNLVAAINTEGTYTASNGTPSTAVVAINYEELDTDITTTNTTSFSISTDDCIVVDAVPSNIVAGVYIDFLQTKPGHKIIDYDIKIPTGGVSGTTVCFNAGEIPSGTIVGDYICLQNTCIIPFLPTDLHSGLAERTSGRILAAMGDQQGLQNVQQKIGEIKHGEGVLLDSRTESAPQKVLARHSLLRYGKMGSNRRL